MRSFKNNLIKPKLLFIIVVFSFLNFKCANTRKKDSIESIEIFAFSLDYRNITGSTNLNNVSGGPGDIFGFCENEHEYSNSEQRNFKFLIRDNIIVNEVDTIYFYRKIRNIKKIQLIKRSIINKSSKNEFFNFQPSLEGICCILIFNHKRENSILKDTFLINRNFQCINKTKMFSLNPYKFEATLNLFPVTIKKNWF